MLTAVCLARFLSKVTVQPGGCWLWTGARVGDGYGCFNIPVPESAPVRYRAVSAHRVAYEHFIGPLTPELEIDHLCRERRCVNVNHLEEVTHAENLRRMPVRPVPPGGDQHWTRRFPERVARGDEHYTRKTPGLKRGVWNGRAKLTEDDVRAIRASAEPSGVLAARHGVGRTAIKAIRAGRMWSHVG